MLQGSITLPILPSQRFCWFRDMTSRGSADSPISAGSIDGLGRIYSEFGGPILRSQENVLAQLKGVDMAAYGSWRIFFPRRLFHPLPGTPSGTMYVTSQRLIFLRGIDVWKEVKPLLTPLGLPAAAEKESVLQKLKAKGALQYCEILPSQLQLTRVKRKPMLLHLRLLSRVGGKFEMFVYTDREDPDFFNLLEDTMRRQKH